MQRKSIQHKTPMAQYEIKFNKHNGWSELADAV